MSWLDTAMSHLSDVPDNSNLKSIIRKHANICKELPGYSKQYQEMCELHHRMTTESLEGEDMDLITNMWNEMLGIKEKRIKDIEEIKVMDNLKQTVVLIESRLTDQVVFYVFIFKIVE